MSNLVALQTILSRVETTISSCKAEPAVLHQLLQPSMPPITRMLTKLYIFEYEHYQEELISLRNFKRVFSTLHT